MKKYQFITKQKSQKRNSYFSFANAHREEIQSSGFTLIELLVVIAIIGILSSVVLASLQTARSKGQDATIISDLDGLRTQAGIYNSTNGGYGTNTALESTCAAADNLFNDATVKNQIAGVQKMNNNGTVVCNVAANGTAYAVSSPLVAAPGTFYCVDSLGVGTTTTAALSATATNC